MGNEESTPIACRSTTTASRSSTNRRNNNLKSPKNLTEADYAYLTIQTGLQKEKINEMLAQFMENNPDGRLNRAEFSKLYHKLKPDVPEKVDKITEFVFRAFDTDKNGWVNFEEFLIGYALTNKSDPRAKLEYAFGIYDKDKNGALDKGEIRAVFKGMIELLGGDKRPQNIENMAEDFIKSLDTSNDGLVKKDEFINGVLKNQKLVSLITMIN